MKIHPINPILKCLSNFKMNSNKSILFHPRLNKILPLNKNKLMNRFTNKKKINSTMKKKF